MRLSLDKKKKNLFDHQKLLSEDKVEFCQRITQQRKSHT